MNCNNTICQHCNRSVPSAVDFCVLCGKTKGEAVYTVSRLLLPTRSEMTRSVSESQGGRISTRQLARTSINQPVGSLN